MFAAKIIIFSAIFAFTRSDREVALIFGVLHEQLDLICTTENSTESNFCQLEKIEQNGAANLVLRPALSINIMGYERISNHTAECGVRILNVSLEDYGNWSVTAIGKANGVTYNRNCEIIVKEAVRPTNPVIKHIENVLDADFDGSPLNNTVDIKCCSEGGVPVPELAILFDGLEINSTLTDTQFEHVRTCLTWPSVTFVYANASEVRCLQKHVTYDGNWTDKVFVSVLHGPFLVTRNDSTLNFTVTGNPKPTVSGLPPWVRHDFKESIKYAKTWDIILSPNYDVVGTANLTFNISVHNTYGNLIVAVTIIGHPIPTNREWISFRTEFSELTSLGTTRSPQTEWTTRMTTPYPSQDLRKPVPAEGNKDVLMTIIVSGVVLAVVMAVIGVTKWKGLLCFRKIIITSNTKSILNSSVAYKTHDESICLELG